MKPNVWKGKMTRIMVAFTVCYAVICLNEKQNDNRKMQSRQQVQLPNRYVTNSDKRYFVLHSIYLYFEFTHCITVCRSSF